MTAENATGLEDLRGKLRPIPEYHPTTGVVLSGAYGYINFDLVKKFRAGGVKNLYLIHTQGDDYVQKSIETLSDQLQKDGLNDQIKITPIEMPSPVGDTVAGWTRDFGPLTFRRQDDPQNVILDFKYYSYRPTENAFNKKFARENSLPIVKVPIKFEGGNFVAAELHDKMYCLTTTVLFTNNINMAREKIIDIFKNIMGCDELLDFPSMPYEGTSHIDMWAKAVKKDVLFVAELGCAAQRYSNNPERAQEIANYLDKNAKILKRLGFTVVRIPMPSPLFFDRGFNKNHHIFRSYINSLIINDWVMIPRYLAPNPILSKVGIYYYPDASLIDEYEKKTWSEFLAAGLKPVWVNMDDRCPLGGSIHCATMQVP